MRNDNRSLLKRSVLILLLLATATLFLLSPHQRERELTADRKEASESYVNGQDTPQMPTTAALPAEAAEEVSPFVAFEDWSSKFLAADETLKPAFIPEGMTLAQARHDALLELIRRDPENALRSSLPATVRKQLPRGIAALIEEEIDGSGSYTVNCVVGLPGSDHSKNDLTRIVQINGRQFRAYVYGNRESQLTAENTPLSGIALDDELALRDVPMRGFGDASIGSSDVANRPEPSWTQGPKKVLVIRVDFPDMPGEPVFAPNTNIVITPAYGAAVFNQANGVRDFYVQNSYGKTDLVISETDITPVYRMPSNAVWYAAGDGNRFYGAEMQTSAYAAAAANYDLNQYQLIGLVHSSLANLPNSRMSFAGQATIGGKYFFINGYYCFSVLAHELGHNYGINHANWWKPSNNTTIGTESDLLANFENGAMYGISMEYGDVYDAMGANSSLTTDIRYHFNHWLKNMLHWIPDNSVQTVLTSGVYRVHRFDTNNVGLVNNRLALKICRDQRRDFWVGYRRQFTNTLTAATVLFGYNHNRASDLLDCNTPGSNLGDALLQVGQSLNDTNAGVTITPIAAGGVAPDEYLDIQVTLQPRVSFVSDLVPVETVAGSASVTVERLGNWTGVTTVNYSCLDGTGSNGATNGVHYVGSSGTLTWLNGDATTRTLTFPVINYPGSNGFRDFTVQLSSPTNAVLINPSTAKISLRPPGNYDPRFIPEPGGVVYALNIQQDGKVLVGGSFTYFGYGPNGASMEAGRFVRVNTNGTRDFTFICYPGADNTVRAVRIQSDGRLVIGGNFSSIHGVTRTRIARLMPDGSLDTSFVPPTITGAAVNDIAIQPDGKIVLVGSSGTVNGQTSIGICRLNPDGSVDFVGNYPGAFNIFEMNGVALDNYDNAIPNGVRMLVSGGFYSSGTSGIVRLNPDGTRDTTFQIGGSGAVPSCMAVQADGKILLGGTFTSFSGDNSRQTLVRLNRNGGVDNTFNPNITHTSGSSSVYSIFVQPDGKIMIGGNFNRVDAATNQYLARLTETGALDTSWDNGIGSANGSTQWPFAFALSSDRRLFVGVSGNGITRGAPGRYFNQAGYCVVPLFTGMTNEYGIGQFASPNYAVRPGGAIHIAVPRVGGNAGDVKLDYATQNGTGLSGTDFMATQGTLTWTNGETGPKDVVVNCPSGATPGRTFRLNLGIIRGGIRLAQNAGTELTLTTNYTYELWRAEYFNVMQQLDNSVSGEAAHPGDGVPNLLRYSLNLDPFTLLSTNLPSATLAADRLRLVYLRDPNRVDLRYEVQASDDLSTWNAIARSSAMISTNIAAFSVNELATNGWLEVIVDDSQSASTAPKRFMRLKLSR